ncbi:hypothetical protein MTR_3g055680 [Medicago truncatula]|uniref:Uncharacterized protein n=1 Tax=Medicago truncatula TaxID=3880 RepID=G7J1G2_MEDTR|nr:hypothetical protein MTR_3g055680 [Medicago truncatula]
MCVCVFRLFFSATDFGQCYVVIPLKRSETSIYKIMVCGFSLGEFGSSSESELCSDEGR